MILHALVVLRFGIKWRLFCINFVFKKTQNEKKQNQVGLQQILKIQIQNKGA